MQKNPTQYIFNPEDPAETSRLLIQDRELTRAMGGLLPSHLDPDQLHVIVDLACGPGGWALDVARSYPHIEVIGIDISEKMIRFAQAQARVLGLENVSFQVSNVLAPLPFPADSFELVNARFISSFLSKEDWPRLLTECVRILHPSGVLRVTDSEIHCTNKPATDRIATLITQALHRAGKSFAPDGRMHGVTMMLSQLLREAGVIEISQQAHVLDSSFGTEEHEAMTMNTMMTLPLLEPFLLRMGVTTKDEFAALTSQVPDEMRAADFRHVLYFLSAWGHKAP